VPGRLGSVLNSRALVLLGLSLLVLCGFFFEIRSVRVLAGVEYPTKRLRSPLAERSDMVKASFNLDEQLPALQKVIRLTLAKPKVNKDDMRHFRGEDAVTPQSKATFSALQFEDDAAIWDRDREISRVDQFTLGPKQMSGWSTGSILSFPVDVIDPLLHLPLLQINRPSLQFSLSFNGLQRPNSSNHAPQANERKGDGGPSRHACIEERVAFNVTNVLFFGLGLGSFAGSLLMAFCINYKRKLLSAALIGIPGLVGASSPVWLFYSSFVYPHSWGLPPDWIPERWRQCPDDTDQQTTAHVETVSQTVLTRFSFPYYNNYMANVLSSDKQTAIIGALCEGSSIRSIERTTGIHRDTIMRLGVKVGQGCTALMDAKMRNLSCTRLECDEIWGFIGKKDRHVRPDDDPQFGNVWTYCAIDADTKLVPTFRVAKDRDVKTTTAFMLDVADRMKNRVQISTDGLAAYVDAIDWAFSGNVDYGQIIKTYGTEESVEAQRRYSAPKINSVEKKAVYGRPEFDLISTSYVERLNATTRLHMKRLARLTHAFSKKRENFEAAVGLHFAYYNFVRRHSTLRCTPAMAAGVTATFWTVEDLVRAA